MPPSSNFNASFFFVSVRFRSRPVLHNYASNLSSVVAPSSKSVDVREIPTYDVMKTTVLSQIFQNKQLCCRSDVVLLDLRHGVFIFFVCLLLHLIFVMWWISQNSAAFAVTLLISPFGEETPNWKLKVELVPLQHAWILRLELLQLGSILRPLYLVEKLDMVPIHLAHGCFNAFGSTARPTSSALTRL